MNKFFHPAFILRFVIAIGYIVLGILVLFLPISMKLLNKSTQPLFALLLIIYGGFRIYRAFQIIKEEE